MQSSFTYTINCISYTGYEVEAGGQNFMLLEPNTPPGFATVSGVQNTPNPNLAQYDDLQSQDEIVNEAQSALALGGDDTLLAREGDDILYAGAGNDVVVAGRDDDVIYGEAGNDTLYGDTTAVRDPNKDSDDFEFDPNTVTNAVNGPGPTGNSIIYNDVAVLSDGTIVDARVTVIGVSDPNLQVNLTSTGTVPNVVLLNGNNDAAMNGETAPIQVEFLDAATGQPININGTFSFSDLDQAQGTEQVTISQTEFDSYELLNNTNLTLSQTGQDYTFSGTENNTTQTDEGAQVNLDCVARSSFTVTFTSRGINSGFGFDTNDFTGASTVTDISDDGDDGGEGIDRIDAGAGQDTIALFDLFNADVIYGGEDEVDDDLTDASGMVTSGIDIVMSSAKAETLSDQVNAAGSFAEIEEFILTNQDDSFDASALSTGVTVAGLDGNDIFRSGTGNDVIYGDGDTIYFDDLFGTDVIYGGESGTDFDTLDARAVNTHSITVDFTGDEDGTVSDGTNADTQFTGIEAMFLGT